VTAARTFRGANLDEALTVACAELRSRVGELRYEVVSEGGGNGVELSAEIDPVAVLGLFLSESFRAGQLDVSAQLEVGEESLDGELKGGDLHLLTGGGGRGLDALQYLCNRVLTRRFSHHLPVHLDTQGFKGRRAQQLRERASSAADEAVRTRTQVVIGPLTPAARREIHLALADDPGVETFSDGEGFLKRVVVRPIRGR
jgi:spoIIIJ-associated protein